MYVYLYECVLSLEVTLQKRSEGPMWSELVIGDRRGEYVMSDEQAALIHERLTHLTSEDMVRLITSIVNKQPASHALNYFKLCRALPSCPNL